MIIQEVNCPLKSKEETNRPSIYLYLMLQGFCFQLWRVPGKRFLKSLILGANLNVLEAAPGPWSLAHCIYNPWAFHKDRNRRRETLMVVKKWEAALFWICAGIFGQKWILQNWLMCFFANGDDLPTSFCPAVGHSPIDSPLLPSPSSCLGILVAWHQLWSTFGWLALKTPTFFFFLEYASNLCS